MTPVPIPSTTMILYEHELDEIIAAVDHRQRMIASGSRPSEYKIELCGEILHRLVRARERLETPGDDSLPSVVARVAADVRKPTTTVR